MKLAVAGFLGGAKSRLLPIAIPFRFFIAASLFHIAAWSMLLIAAPLVPDFVGGPGPVLGAIHLLTLGVLAMTAIGAALQLLPVATRQTLPAVWPARLLSWLYIPGVIVFAAGLIGVRHEVMALGAAIVIVGLLLFGYLLAHNLLGAKGMAAIVSHAWAALAALAALAVIGFLLIVAQEHAVFADHAAWALLHLAMAAYGFMGLLAFGFSYVLVPMFALAPPVPVALAYGSLAAAIAAIVAAVGAAAFGVALLWIAAAAIGLVAAGLYLVAMRHVLAQRMRKQLGPSFVMARVAWVLLPASLLAGLALAVGAPWPRLPALFGFLLLFGWLLTFLLAMLQRIAPFLASMHASRNGPPPLLSALTPELPLRVHFHAHWLALLGVGGGIVGGMPLLVRLGAAVGVVGAIAFALFVGGVMRRLAATHADTGAAPASD